MVKAKELKMLKIKMSGLNKKIEIKRRRLLDDGHLYAFWFFITLLFALVVLSEIDLNRPTQQVFFLSMVSGMFFGFAIVFLIMCVDRYFEVKRLKMEVKNEM